MHTQNLYQGSSTNLSGSLPSLPDEGSQQQQRGSTANTEVPTHTAHDNVSVDHDSIKTAKNLARVFSLEDTLKREFEFSQDEFSSKIPQFLMEVTVAPAARMSSALGSYYDSMCIYDRNNIGRGTIGRSNDRTSTNGSKGFGKT